MSEKPDWIIHGVCDGQHVNFHTHGMEKYGHMDFQIVLPYPHQELCRILNTLGFQVREGHAFKAGERIPGIYLDCDVKVLEFEETGRTVLRVIVPDKNNRFPDEAGCEYPYTLQSFPTDFLIPVDKGQVPS